jgi:dTDP-glucose 4,6-dehydratase
MKTILITGAAGFIGGRLTRLLFERYPGYRIIAYDALTYAGSIDNFEPEMIASPRFRFVYGNVCNTAQVAEAMSETDVVFHLAAETHVTRSIHDSITFVETDVLGTASVAGAAVKHRARIERFIHLSSSEVYGSRRGDRAAMDEEHPLEPCSPYAGAKNGADRLVHAYWKTYGLPAVIVRPFNNYGPFQHLEKVIPRFITSALLGEPLTVHGAGFSARDWTHVEDTCEALDLLLHAPLERVRGETFNVGTGVDTDVLSVAKMILAILEKPEELITWIGDRPGQVESHRADARKAKRVFGWEARTCLDEGLRRTIAWYRANEPFWRRQMWMRKIEIETLSGREWH